MRFIELSTSIGLAAALLSACSLSPTYKTPQMELPANFKEEPGWRAAAPADDVARGEWWKLFDDPVLNDLQQQVLVSNQNLAAAKAAYDQSRALVRELRASWLPSFDLSVSGSKAGSFGRRSPSVGNSGAVNSTGSSGYAASIGATWEPDLWGRIGDNVRQAGMLAHASGAELANATLAAQGELALNYVQLRGIEAQERVFDDTIAAYERALSITQNRYAAGVVGRADVLQAETALRNARANVADLGRQRSLYEHAIAVLAGVNPSTFTLSGGEWLRVIPDVPAALPSALLERRPDIAAAQRRVAAANFSIGIERSAFFPVLQLTGDAGFSAGTVSSLFDSTNSVWSLGAVGALTLLDFGARSARVEQAKAAYRQTVAEYRQTVLLAFQQTEDQLAGARVLQVVAAEREAAAAAANRAEEIARNQYLAGQIGYSDVIVTQTAALAARQAEIQALVDRQSAAISLIQAIGGHWGQ